MFGGRSARIQGAVPLLLIAVLMVPGLGPTPGGAHMGQSGTVSASGGLEAEAYDFPDPGCDPHPEQQPHRHTHTEVGATPPVGTGAWFPWRGCSITFYDVHFDRTFQFQSSRAESLHDSLPWYNPWWTTITHSVYIGDDLHARGTTRSYYWEVQFPPPETITLQPLSTIQRGTYDITVRIDMNHESEQNYFLDRLDGTWGPASPPAPGPCANAPILPPSGLTHNAMAGGRGWDNLPYLFVFGEPAIDPEGDPLTYTWEWAGQAATSTSKRYTSHAFPGIGDRTFTVRVTDDPSTRCTDTPPRSVTVSVPFRTIAAFRPTIVDPPERTLCTYTGTEPFNTNVVVGSCYVEAAVDALGHPDLVGAVELGSIKQATTDHQPFATDSTAPYSGFYSSWRNPIGPGYLFYACATAAGDIHGREFCRYAYQFWNV